MIEPTNEQIEAFRAAWIEADLQGATGDRVRQGLRAALNLQPAPTTIHAAPVDEGVFTPCCDRTPFELPHTDRMTLDPVLVTCPGSAS